MNFENLNITDHAFKRWNERTFEEKGNVENVTTALKNSKIISKKEFLPFGIPRKSNTVYAFNGSILFVLEPIKLNEYRLITLYSESCLFKRNEFAGFKKFM